jgi:hypothetical protein
LPYSSRVKAADFASCFAIHLEEPMLHFIRPIGACLAGYALSLLLTAPANAVNAVAQGPCAYTGGVCLSFNNTTSPIPIIRSFSFNMPAAGKALIRFDGTMQCVVGSATTGQDVIDLASQIVGAAAAVPAYTGPGGNRYAMRLHHNGDPFGPSTTVNLAASRLINYASAGSKGVHFKFAKLRMDPGTSCLVYDAAFTVVTFP